MSSEPNELSSTEKALSGGDAAISHLEQSIAAGEHWYVALLEAIGLWTKAEEIHSGRAYRYLVAGEAFDWLLLAERLCEAVDSLIPADERDSLLYRGEAPLNLTSGKFKELIGAAKYHQYLNYFYGVTAEEALVLAVEEEIHKEKRSWGYNRESDVTNEAYRRVYGSTLGIMLRHFRQEKAYAQSKSLDLAELKEFTYWRFKFRLKMCEKAKVASDTRKALTWLKAHGIAGYVRKRDLEQEFIDDLGDGETSGSK